MSAHADHALLQRDGLAHHRLGLGQASGLLVRVCACALQQHVLRRMRREPALRVARALLRDLQRPLVLAEVGLDSQRNGREKQAEVLGWQVRTAGAAGCAGAILFAWTDEWHRSNAEILDWDFGLVDRERSAVLVRARAARPDSTPPDSTPR